MNGAGASTRPTETHPRRHLPSAPPNAAPATQARAQPQMRHPTMWDGALRAMPLPEWLAPRSAAAEREDAGVGAFQFDVPIRRRRSSRRLVHYTGSLKPSASPSPVETPAARGICSPGKPARSRVICFLQRRQRVGEVQRVGNGDVGNREAARDKRFAAVIQRGTPRRARRSEKPLAVVGGGLRQSPFRGFERGVAGHPRLRKGERRVGEEEPVEVPRVVGLIERHAASAWGRIFRRDRRRYRTYSVMRAAPSSKKRDGAERVDREIFLREHA